ncbi:hypothetical protein MRX96_006807 [Rhipicephalus microplus]
MVAGSVAPVLSRLSKNARLKGDWAPFAERVSHVSRCSVHLSASLVHSTAAAHGRRHVDAGCEWVTMQNAGKSFVTGRGISQLFTGRNVYTSRAAASTAVSGSLVAPPHE